jgi:hypothetical protein
MMQTGIIEYMKAAVPAPAKEFLKNAIYTRRYAIKRRVLRTNLARKITKIDAGVIPKISTEIRAFMAVRNESLRLPFMLDYYLGHGIDRIFVIDNNSTDDTASIVSSRHNTHLFFTNDDYWNQGYWMDFLLNRYGVDHWCLIVDADEVLIYPNYETVCFRQLCGLLADEPANAMDCVLLDMYPDLPLSQIEYKRGTNPLSVADWFDNTPYVGDLAPPRYMHQWNMVYNGPKRVRGGMRKRVFGINPIISKFPLVKFNKSMFISRGAHFIQNAQISTIRGGLLHFKYLHDFVESVKREVKREQHFENATEYRSYLKSIESCQDLYLKSPLSEKFRDSEQLVSLGILKTSDKLQALAKGEGLLISLHRGATPGAGGKGG